jgi:hypothetical protein
MWLIVRSTPKMGADSHLGRMLTARQVAAQLAGRVSAHNLLRMARRGKIAGAVRIGHRVYFDARTAGWLVQDLSAGNVISDAPYGQDVVYAGPEPRVLAPRRPPPPDPRAPKTGFVEWRSIRDAEQVSAGAD